MDRLLRPVMSSTSSSPAATASSTTYWIAGLSTRVSISLGVALVAGRNRVPRPAAGMTALRTWALLMAGTVHLALQHRECQRRRGGADIRIRLPGVWGAPRRGAVVQRRPVDR